MVSDGLSSRGFAFFRYVLPPPFSTAQKVAIAKDSDRAIGCSEKAGPVRLQPVRLQKKLKEHSRNRALEKEDIGIHGALPLFC